VYVDDIIITGNVSTFVAAIINKLGHTFSVKDMGHLHFFLGIEVIPTAKGLFLSQHKYIRDLLSKTSMDMTKDIHTPMSTSTPLLLTMVQPLQTAQNIEELLGHCNILA
jgi:hypothetical protein